MNETGAAEGLGLGVLRGTLYLELPAVDGEHGALLGSLAEGLLVGHVGGVLSAGVVLIEVFNDSKVQDILVVIEHAEALGVGALGTDTHDDIVALLEFAGKLVPRYIGLVLVFLLLLILGGTLIDGF